MALYCCFMFNSFMGFNVITIERLYFTKGRIFGFILVLDSKLQSVVKKSGTKFAAHLQLSGQNWVVDTGSWPYSWLHRVLSSPSSPFSLLSISSKPLSVLLGIRRSINNLPYAKPEVNTDACSLQVGNEMTQPREEGMACVYPAPGTSDHTGRGACYCQIFRFFQKKSEIQRLK